VNKFFENLANLIKVKSLMTLAMTYGMIMLLSGSWNPSSEIVALYSASYGAIITYFFKKNDKEDIESK